MGDATPQLRSVAILPARLGSTRLPRKMLLAESGAPLFVHAARNVARCPQLGRVVVATDSEEIAAAGAEAGIEMVMTRADHRSGTDRVHEALALLTRDAGATFDVVVNVQADEPDVDPADLARLVDQFKDSSVDAGTLCVPIDDEAVLAKTSVVKVVRDAHGDALYFSRAPIPATKDPAQGRAVQGALRHIGVYAFRPEALARFVGLPPSRLEQTEGLEQLRWLEAGERMRVLDAGHIPLGIDTRADYEAFVARCATDKVTGSR